MQYKKKLVGAVSLALIILGSSCSTMKIERDRVSKIRNAAIVGFSLEQTMPNTGEGVLKSLLEPTPQTVGGMNLIAAEIATPAAHATQMYQELSDKLAKELGWRMFDRKALAQTPDFVQFRSIKTKQPQLRPLVASKNVSIFIPEGVVETFLLNNMTFEERKSLLKKLGVDALVLAHVRVGLENGGGLKTLVGAGELHSKATLGFRVFTSDQEEPIWMDSYAAGESTKEAVEHTLGFADVGVLNKQAIVATRSAYQALLQRYKNQ